MSIIKYRRGGTPGTHCCAHTYTYVQFPTSYYVTQLSKRRLLNNVNVWAKTLKPIYIYGRVSMPPGVLSPCSYTIVTWRPITAL